MQELINFITKYIQPDEDEIHYIISVIQHTNYSKNDFLIRQGESSNKLVFVLKGAARAYYIDENETEHTCEFIFENQAVIHIEAFTKNTPSMVNVITIEDTEIIWVSRDTFFEFLENFPDTRVH
ncbi:MAG: cyclic nucleotide-binding domain-containing protein [Sphingobacteriales bacterium]|nr:cyclic nucleotide-binding domain-containing protein [Sphingobacteriales bacterium]